MATAPAKSQTRKRVVITGMGIAAPGARDFEQYWSVVASGKSALSRFTRLEIDGFPVKVAGTVDDELLSDEPTDKPPIHPDRIYRLARAAMRRAIKDSALENPSEAGIVLGTGMGPSESAENSYGTFFKEGYQALRARTVPWSMYNTIASHLSIEFNCRGPQLSIGTACASANSAMCRAAEMIQSGRTEFIFTGGAEMPLAPTVLGSWLPMRVLSLSDDPQRALLPFHKKRSGLCLAEGAGVFLFEELEHARQRGAHIYAEVLGFGETSDATHITHPNAEQQARAITLALKDAGVTPAQVDYINAHGTGTLVNDIQETLAIRAAFGDFAPNVPVSSTKSVLGHSLGASGALELPAVIGAITHQTVPPTANLTELDPKCDLDFVPCQARPHRVRVAISQSFAFGGINSVIVLGKLIEEA